MGMDGMPSPARDVGVDHARRGGPGDSRGPTVGCAANARRCCDVQVAHPGLVRELIQCLDPVEVVVIQDPIRDSRPRCGLSRRRAGLHGGNCRLAGHWATREVVQQDDVDSRGAGHEGPASIETHGLEGCFTRFGRLMKPLQSARNGRAI